MLASGELADASANMQPNPPTPDVAAASDMTNVQDEFAAGLEEALEETAELHERREDAVELSEGETATHDPAEL